MEHLIRRKKLRQIHHLILASSAAIAIQVQPRILVTLLPEEIHKHLEASVYFRFQNCEAACHQAGKGEESELED